MECFKLGPESARRFISEDHVKVAHFMMEPRMILEFDCIITHDHNFSITKEERSDKIGLALVLAPGQNQLMI